MEVAGDGMVAGVSTRLLSSDLLNVPIETPIAAGKEVIEGFPTAGYTALAELGPNVEVGIWEITKGGAKDVEGDEVFFVLAGHATLVFDDETLDLRPGTLVRLRAGEHTEWRVHEPLRKLYMSI
jgi:uncharacterized protein